MNYQIREPVTRLEKIMITAICAVVGGLLAMLILGGCTHAPAFAKGKQIAYSDDGKQDAGVAGHATVNGVLGYVITDGRRAEYAHNFKIYGTDFPGLKDADDGWTKIAEGNWCRPDVFKALVAMEIWAANPELAPTN